MQLQQTFTTSSAESLTSATRLIIATAALFATTLKTTATLISAAVPSLTTATASILQHQRLVAGRTDIGSTYLFHINSIPVELSSVCLSVCVSVNIFKLEYLRNQWADRNEILSEPPLGWGKGCFRFWARSDRNSGVHGNG